MNAQSINSADRPELHHVVNSAIVALVGMLAGFLVGYVYGHGAKDFPADRPEPVVAHPRALQPKSP